VKEIGEVYHFLADMFEQTNEADTAFAMGTYFRVVYFGRCIPEHLKFEMCRIWFIIFFIFLCFFYYYF